jgi:hypothetical protein
LIGRLRSRPKINTCDFGRRFRALHSASESTREKLDKSINDGLLLNRVSIKVRSRGRYACLGVEIVILNAVIKVDHMVVEDRISRLECDIAGIKRELAAAELKRAVESLRAAAESLERWTIGTGIFTVLGASAVVEFMLR